MIIAVASEGMKVAAQANSCESFMCYDIDKGIVRDCRNLPNTASNGRGAACHLVDVGIDVLITGGIDAEMAAALNAAGIEVVVSDDASPRDAVDAYIENKLMGAANDQSRL